MSLVGLVLVFLLHSGKSDPNQLTSDVLTSTEEPDFLLLLQEIMLKYLHQYKCISILTDNTYQDLFSKSWFKRFQSQICFVMLNIDESEDLLAPSNETKESLSLSKKEGCQMYIILLANGLQVARLLKFGDRYRFLNTRSKYVMLFDNRIFDKSIFFIWKRIINVVFIKEYVNRKGDKKKNWFEITTVPFPSTITNVFVPRRLDIWAQGKFRKNAELFRDKSDDLKNQTLKVVTFPHLPATERAEMKTHKTARAVLGNISTGFSGTEVEILQTISQKMNFKVEIYEPENSEYELWGEKRDGKHTGIIGEMTNSFADIALADLYYTPYILDLMDLSVPYNTECLTFLTPEALSDNSWKTLILPFKPLMWVAVVVCLIVCSTVFHLIAKFHVYLNKYQDNKKRKQIARIKKKKVLTLSVHPEFEKLNANVKYILMKEKYQPPTVEGQPSGLYQFSEIINSFLYTYSMLLLVSLPKLPTGWSLRMFTGWYWLYCLLLVVAYRASMTAILARPTPRITIDTLEQLLESKLTYGGWGELSRQFFKSSKDPTVTRIGEKFQIVNDSAQAVDNVAEASFAFYENIYFLKEAVVKRQFRFQNSQTTVSLNKTEEAKAIARMDRSLHIMKDCIINMPVSIGLQKNSPIKPNVDKYIRKVLEAGLIKKWLDDVMQRVLNAEIQTPTESSKALMNIDKFFGALVALFIGYLLGIIVLIVEIVYFNRVVKRNPAYNKYSKMVQDGRKLD